MRTKDPTELAESVGVERASGTGPDWAAMLMRGLVLLAIGLGCLRAGSAQEPAARSKTASSEVSAAGTRSAAARFLGGRTVAGGTGSLAAAVAQGRAEHGAMVRAQALAPRISSLSAAWQPVGPGQVASLAYGTISGRVSSIAIDPGDSTGNTVYVGTTGGGVWKSTNAAGSASAVSFAPLMDNLPVFSANAGDSATPSISIGAVSAQLGGIVLAGTGDTNDALDSYYGSGILRSADGGLSWSLIQNSHDGVAGTHSFLGLGFAGFAWSTVNPSLVVAVVSQSAEGLLVNAQTTNSVMGLYVSTDAGVTWGMATISDGNQTVESAMSVTPGMPGVAATSVVWNPERQRFYAAVRYHGYYESRDGMSWSRLANQPGVGMTLAACPTNPGLGAASSCPVFRGTLAVQPVTGDTFAITTDRNNVDQGLWQDVCSLTRGSCASSTLNPSIRIASAALEVGSGSAVIAEADYNLSLAAVPSGTDTLLYVGTGDLYRCSLAAGCVLRNTTNATNACAAPAQVAPSEHALAVVPGSTLLFVGNDSGLWRSKDGANEQGAPCSADDASHFENLNGGLGSLAEVVSFGQDPGNATNLLVGLGASGTASSAGNVATPWPQLSTGEGGTVAIDPSNPMLWYISTAGGVSVGSCASGARCGAADYARLPSVGPLQVNGDASVIDAPWVLDPAMSSNVVVGTCRVWRGPVAAGSSWSGANQLSPMLGGPQNAACVPATNPLVRSLAAGGPPVTKSAAQQSGSRVLYAGMAGLVDGGGVLAGHVLATMSADLASSTVAWADLAGSNVTNDVKNIGLFNPGGFDISSLAADPHDATGRTIYATVMGFSANGISAPRLYGSTDGGGHWLNLTANLPNSPGNSVVVDPNDANTVYIALDTGVYVTTQVASCASGNCWSVFGASLPNSPAIELAAAGAMATGDGRAGMLRVGTYGRGIWQIPLLTAAYPQQPVMTLSDAGLVFGSQAVGTISAAQTITVTNTGNAPLLVSRTATTGDFAIADGCSGTAVAVNASCSVQVKFLPSAQGARTGVLRIYGNVSGGQGTATLAGTGTAPGDAVLSPLSLVFPSMTVNATSAAQSVTLSNVGAAATSLQAPVVSGDFHMSANTCGTSLAASASCAISVVFTPTASGTRNGSLSITASSGVQTAILKGTATMPPTDTLSPGSLGFGPQQIGTASAPQLITVTNVGDVALTLISAQITSGDFLAVNGCGNSLNAHSTCSIQVVSAPKSLGAGTGVLVVGDEFRSQTVALSNMGVAPPGVSISPSSAIAFPETAVGSRSPVQVVTLTNNGGLPLTIQSVMASGDFVVASGGSCGSTLASGSACTLGIAFVPTAGGARTGGLVIADNAPSSPQSLAFTGMGIDFNLAADGSTTATVANGKTATFPLLLDSAAGVSGSAAFTCTGAPVNATCTVAPGTAPLGTTTLIRVNVATGTGAAALVSTSAGAEGKGFSSFLMAGVLPLGLLVLRRRRVAGLLGVILLVCVVGAGGGCGVTREIPLPGTSATGQVGITPPGTYTVTVGATAAGLTRTMELKVTVQ